MITYETTFWRTDYVGDKLEDITEAFVEGRAVMDTDNDQTWSLDAVVTYEGWRHLTPYLDWVVPHLKVTYPDGFVAQGNLGLYLVLDSPEEHGESWGRVQLQTGDPLWMVARAGLEAKLKVDPGTQKDAAVRKILDGVPLTDNPQGHRRFMIPDTHLTFRKAHEWPRTDNRLVISNEILQGMACYPLWDTKNGLMLSKRRGEARLRQRHPVRTFSAHLPRNQELLPRHQPWGGYPSNVVGTINTTPKGQDLMNEILMINDDPDFPRVHVKSRISHPDNPRATRRARHHTRRIHNKTVEEDATAREVAESLLDELSTLNSTIRLEVHPDPRTEFARETVACKIWGESGYKIADGQYAVHRVEYGLRPKSGTMVMDLGRIDDASDVVF